MRSFIFIILSLIFYFSFFSRGLYFEKDLYGVHILIYVMYIILIVRLLVRKEESNVIYFSFLYIIPLLYIIAISYALFPLGAVHQALKWLTFVSFFIVIYWASYQTEWVKKWLPYIFQFTGVSISIHMFLNVLGVIESVSALKNDRFYGSLQYPNTFGMVIGVFFMFSLIMLTKRKLILREIIIYSLPLTIYLYVLVGTLSRGMFVVLPIALIVTFLFRNIKSQLFMVVTIIVASMFTIIEFIVPMSNVMMTVGILFFSLLTVVVVYYLRQLFIVKGTLKLFSDKPVYTFILPVITSVLGILLVFDLLSNGFVYRILPSTAQQLVDRLSRTSSFDARVLFVQDSFELSKQAPLFGIGGEGFTSVYRGIQQVPYRSKRIHNEFMEVLVNLGWFGVIMFTIVAAILLYWIYVNWKKSARNSIHLAVFIGLLIIFLHSLLDFDMQYAATWFLLLWLLTMSLATETSWLTEGTERIFSRWKRTSQIVLYSATVFAIGGIIVSASFSSAEQSFSTYRHTQDIDYVYEAMKKNPYKSDFIVSYGRALHRLDEDHRDEIQSLAEKLAKLEPRNSHVLEDAAHLASLASNEDLEIQYYYDALSVDNFYEDLYEKLFPLLLADGSPENAKEIIRLFNQFEATYDELMSTPEGQRLNVRGFGYTDKIITQAAQAYYLLEEETELQRLLSLPIEKGATKIELLALNVLLLERKGDSASINELLTVHEIEASELAEKKQQFKEKYE